MMSSFGEFSGDPKTASYEELRHPDLPWGYWLTSVGPVPGEPPLVDDEGNEWRSVREAFWVGRLGLTLNDFSRVNDCLEFMLSYLALMDRRFVRREELVQDLFQGEAHLANFFSAFLEASGIADRHHKGPTVEGRAALLMLIATRDRDDADESIGLDWIGATKGLVRGQQRKAAADLVAEREQTAARMAHRFATDTIEGLPVIKLIGLRITSHIPVRSTLWTMTWEDQDWYARDRFYLWLLERIDRWDAWSALVTEQGTRALTEHFMKLAFCDRFAVLD